MNKVEGFPYFEFEVGKGGEVIDPAARAQALAFFANGGVSDLLVISHGWNNDMGEARALYRNFLAALRLRVDAQPALLPGRTLGVLGVLWPSKKFADQDLIPGQAASVSTGPMVSALRAQITALKNGFDHLQGNAMLDRAKALLPKLADDPQARVEFATQIRDLLSKAPSNDEGHASGFKKTDPSDLLERLSGPLLVSAPRPGDEGGAASMGSVAANGGAASLGTFFHGVFSGAANLLNLTTYYQMKERAGVLGRGAVAALVAEIAAGPKPPKVHLAGHSFGARLVTAVAAAVGTKDKPAIASMTLLQAAFSHNGFAPAAAPIPEGFFRKVVTEHRVSGPVLVTHTVKDTAVGLAYPLASRLAGQQAEALGDEHDPYGGMGRNGPVGTPETIRQDFGKVGTSYAFKRGALYSLNADKLIMSHGDIVHPEIAYAFLCAVAVG